MQINGFFGYILIIICLGLLVTVQRLLHRELQTILLLYTRNSKIALGIFSLLLFPGVLLHEFSHWLMAIILHVPVTNVSFLPKTEKNGKLQLGFVETKATNVVKDALIGFAPFFFGGIVLTFISTKLGLFDVIQSIVLGDPEGFTMRLKLLPQQTDFGIWFYLAFAVSSTMLPSASDRQSWKSILIGVGIILILVVAAGFGDWMLVNIAPKVNIWLFVISLVLAVSIFVHVLLLIPSGLIRIFTSKIMGVQVVNKSR